MCVNARILVPMCIQIIAALVRYPSLTVAQCLVPLSGYPVSKSSRFQ